MFPAIFYGWHIKRRVIQKKKSPNSSNNAQKISFPNGTEAHVLEEILKIRVIDKKKVYCKIHLFYYIFIATGSGI
jgi:hypothetical protein